MFFESLEYALPNFSDDLSEMIKEGSRDSLNKDEQLLFLILCQINYLNHLKGQSQIAYLTPFRNISKLLQSLSRKRYVKVEKDYYEINDVKFSNSDLRIYCYNNSGKVINNYEHSLSAV